MAKKRGKGARIVAKVARKKVAIRALPTITKRKERRKKKEEEAMGGKRKTKRNALAAAFFIIAFVVFIRAFFNQDWYSVAIASVIMLLSLAIFKRKRREEKEKESLKARALIAYGLYFIIWLAALGLAILSILAKKHVYAVVAFCVMFFCSLMTAIVHKNLNKTEVVNAMKKLLQKKSKRYETNFDKLLALLKRYKKLKISHVSKGFGVSKKKVEEWSEILESHNFLKIRYPPFGEAELIAKGEIVKKGGAK